MKKIQFFATTGDILPVLREFERGAPLKYIQSGRFFTPNPPIFLTSFGLPDPGKATHESAIGNVTYLVSHRGTKNVMQPRTLTNGEKCWDIFPVDNEEAVVLSLGGMWTTGTLLPGRMEAMHQNAVTKGLISDFSAALKKEGFKKVRQWWVGPESMEMLKKGKRLATTAEQSPPNMDLELSDS